MDRTLGASKPVDPATRLSELLAQSLEELTRPFDPPRPQAAGAPAPTATVRAVSAEGVPVEHPTEEPAVPEPTPEESRIDADKALAELEAELFAAAKQVNHERTTEEAPPAEPPGDEEPPTPAELSDVREALDAVKADEPHSEPKESDIAPPPLVPDSPEMKPETDADASAVIAKVRKLMLVSMGVTIVAVGSVFGFIGYRMMKGEGMSAKTADKVAPASAIPADITLSIPRGARVVQSAVAADRLILTLDIDGKIEVRTFDVKTLQPAGRLNFSATP